MEDDLTWECRRLHNEELSDMDFSRSIVKVKVKFSRYRPDQALGVPVG
jgi:hypothetical protein